MNRYDQQAETQRIAWIAEANALGQEHGRNAATWVADGNSDEDSIRRLVSMLDDGDPQGYDQIDHLRPNLSGEWAGDLTPSSLYEDITGRDAHADATFDQESYQSLSDALCDAYEEGVDETFESACEAELRAHIA